MQISDWIAGCAVSLPNLWALINWYSRLRTLEATVAQHDSKLSKFDATAERLVRIETKLDLLMDERKGTH